MGETEGDFWRSILPNQSEPWKLMTSETQRMRRNDQLKSSDARDGICGGSRNDQRKDGGGGREGEKCGNEKTEKIKFKQTECSQRINIHSVS